MSIENLLKKYASSLVFVIPLLTLTVYSPVLWHNFVNYDDPVYVTENPNLKAGLTLQGLRWAFTPGYDANWIPLTWISHLLDVQLFGMNPAGHHLVNLLLHAASTTVLFICLKKATGLSWRSGAVALLFALHPLHVESVAWVAERKDVLSGFFWMLTMWAYLRYAEKPAWTRYLLTLLFFSLGLMAKSMLVTLPMVLLLLDYWPLRRLSCNGDRNPAFAPSFAAFLRCLAEKIPFFLLSLCSGVVTYMAHKAGGGTFDQYTLSAKVGRALTYYVAYIGKMLWPAKLAVMYPFSKYPPSAGTIAAAAAVMLLVSIAVWWLRKGYPWLVVGWFWYLTTLLPVIGLIHIGQHSVADRYTYIPLTGLFIIAAWGVPELIKCSPFCNAILGTLSATILMIMIILTSMQLRHWKDGITLFSHATKVTEGNWVAHNNLGQAYFDNGNIEESIKHFNLSIKAKPSYAIAYSNLGVAYYKKGDLMLSLDAFRNVLKFDSLNEKAHFCLGILYLETGQPGLALNEYNILKGKDSSYAIELMKEIVAKTE